MGIMFEENDSLLLSNPKLLEAQPDSAFARICSFDESVLYSNGYFSSRNEVISCFISMINGVDLMSSLPVMYIYKNDFSLPPGLLNVYYAEYPTEGRISPEE
ncbi:conserved hypothetical protein [Theileria equi strain WA]|uniref:Uncharacterized protein n=1 Tax=Theileria equi strain WA TaxID=1537102 RepID=L1LC72_THEEQ|nr:conserved hypothetical protein [Theileria equi strain WA]EKX72845.1 conserved hypothetical protein [Theileria equi strain WA]|eukprot:XP_004832297.1 conserved hypothetical protein [Theileria equi strain WA]